LPPPPAREGKARPASPRIAALPAKGPVARLTVERLGVRMIVSASDGSKETLDRAPTLLKRSGGENPVTILAAHRDTHFLFIRDLLAGDEIALQLVTGEVERYRVTRFETVRWDGFAYPGDPARPLLALTTCYPFGGTEYGGPWRRVAWAERIG
jgi:sortase A